MDWTEQKVLEAIGAYRELPILWDPQHKYYKIIRRKNEAWDYLAKMFDVDIDLMKRKMNSLLASYRRERQKARQFKPPGSDQEYKSSWFAFSHFLFLSEKFKTQENCELASTAEVKFGAEDVGLEENDADDVVVLLQEGDEMTTQDLQAVNHNTAVEYMEPMQNNSIPVEVPVPVRKKKFTPKAMPMKRVINRQEDFRVTEAYNILKNIASTRKDECAIYCEHVANKLRKLDDRGRAIAQHKINNILFEAEIGIYNQGLSPNQADESSAAKAMKLGTRYVSHIN